MATTALRTVSLPQPFSFNRDIPLALIGWSGRVSPVAWTYFSQKKHSCHHHLHTQLREMVVVIGGLGLRFGIRPTFSLMQPTSKDPMTPNVSKPDSWFCTLHAKASVPTDTRRRKCLLLSAWRPFSRSIGCESLSDLVAWRSVVNV